MIMVYPKSGRLNFKIGLALMTLLLGDARAINAGQDFRLRTLSSRPDVISGGDVLVEADVPAQSAWKVSLDGRDVTKLFHPFAASGKAVALLSGLKQGRNVLTLHIKGEGESKLELLNHPLIGPIFSGPHQNPFICQTVENGLGPALDADCSAKSVVQYYYKSTASVAPMTPISEIAGKPDKYGLGFKPYPLDMPPPSDVAQTVTSGGATVPYIVRREIGTINRAVYDIRFLHQPGRPLPSPWMPPTPEWNGRLMYEFPGGCAAGYRQGVLASSLGENPMIARGYAYVTSTLNNPGTDCNDRISAETLSMVKEHFIKTYGVPVHTIGEGASGGTMELHLIAQNYPGLLDGIIVIASFPDLTTYAPEYTDCALLERALGTSKLQWAQAQKTAISGFATWHTCSGLSRFLSGVWPILDPTRCDEAVPRERVYDRLKNPHGVRCTIYDNEINVFGRDPRNGFARRPLDNVGVQYGLVAFNHLQINAQQFVDLNERTGGFDDDGNIVTARTQADPETVRLAYQRGLVLTGGGGLDGTPVIDWHSYTDDLVDHHDHARAFLTRTRLIAANGNAENQVILMSPRPDYLALLIPGRESEVTAQEQEAGIVMEMDRWLDKVEADSTTGTRAAKIYRDRPKGLSDSCVATDGELIVEPASYNGPGRCNQMYPAHGDPRIAAGSPLSNDVLKCALKPLNEADYAQPLNADELHRLQAVFPGGVCDYSRPGVGQDRTTLTWQKF
jgi:hypothetical protein